MYGKRNGTQEAEERAIVNVNVSIKEYHVISCYGLKRGINLKRQNRDSLSASLGS